MPAAARQIGPLELERGRPRGRLARQEGEPEAQTGDDRGQKGDRGDESQVAVSCSTCSR